MFFDPTAATEIYTLSLHDALPISKSVDRADGDAAPTYADLEGKHELDLIVPNGNGEVNAWRPDGTEVPGDRKSTRLNSSHQIISYAVFCLKKKKNVLLLNEVLLLI